MEERPRILVVDDEAVIRNSSRQILENSCCRVHAVNDAQEALKHLAREETDLILLDLKMPGMSGRELLGRIKEKWPGVDVIIITGYSSVDSAVECMRLGAYDYLPKPFDAEALRLVVGRALEKRRLSRENQDLRRRLWAESHPAVLLGQSPCIQHVHEMIERVAPTDSTVLILGESGTGKELVARAIHRASPRRDRPFVAVDCGAIVDTLYESELFGHVRGAFTGAVSARPGRFEQADGGTLFLDEIGHIGAALQGKLLRVLQERETMRVGADVPQQVDVRILAATNQDLQASMRRGEFREDLFYRLSVVLVEIPPLRSRREDIPLLVEGLLSRLSEKKGLPHLKVSRGAMSMLKGYDWPGNVRELENCLERAIVLTRGTEIQADDLQFNPSPLSTHGASGQMLRGLRGHARPVGGEEVAWASADAEGRPARVDGLADASPDGRARNARGRRDQADLGEDGTGWHGTAWDWKGTHSKGEPRPAWAAGWNDQSPEAAAAGRGEGHYGAGEGQAGAADGHAGPAGADLTLADLEARHIRRILDQTGWHQGRAAEILGIDRKTLWRKIRVYQLR